MKRYCLLFIFLPILFSQNNISEAEESLLKLKDEIADLQVLNQELDADIDHNKDMIKAYHYRILLAEKNKRYKEKSAVYISNQISKNSRYQKQLESEIEKVKKSYSQRLVDSYKMPSADNVDLLFNAKSDDDLMRLIYYKKFIDEAEGQLFGKLKDKTADLQATKKLLINQKKRQQQLIVEQKKAIADLNSVHKKYKSELNSNLGNKKKYAAMIKAKEDQTENLKSLIARLSREKTTKSSSAGIVALTNAESAKLSKEFVKNKGRFPKPAQGKVIKPFGKVKVKGLKIYEQSIGIDIASKKGSNATSIFAGIVEQAAYMQGYGNQVIVNHGGGYFTIYSHLNEMLVRKGDRVETNQVIGTVGDSGTFDGIPRLNFAMFGNNKPMNPAKWLR
ncbi:MAG: peptidoglycan DD-metalloendopeptidase family protein [Calditrichaeota bacterium]|nr:peptidoglycan DD-metalloendopeptidase family protein [Calditrichota bacterium]